MVSVKLFVILRYCIRTFKLLVIFFVMSIRERFRKKGFQFSVVSIFCYMIYNFLSRILSRIDDRSTNTSTEINYGKTPKNSPDQDLKEDFTAIRPFKIEVPSNIIRDLNCRLERTRYEDPLENANFRYGFNSDYLRTLTEYWRTKYQWRTQEQELNKYPHFKTRIEGLDIHFIHVRATVPEKRDSNVIPILLIHGSPGSCADYRNVIPLLTSCRPQYRYVFDVVCPSIPGFGFSDSPHRRGFNARAAAGIFMTLMDRLGYSKFYVQGCDWGTVIASLMGRYYPQRVMGIHVNMCFSLPSLFDFVAKMIVMAIFPFQLNAVEKKMIFPFKKKLLDFQKETGYFHFKSTKPDTVGCCLADSPSGMLACVLERFCSTIDLDYLDLPDGGLTERFMPDELLTVAMIIWVNNNFSSSARFSKESLRDVFNRTHENVLLTVPCGVAVFPNEMVMLPQSMISDMVEDLVSYTIMPRGGHYPALEEPHLLADDVWKFVQRVENRSA